MTKTYSYAIISAITEGGISVGVGKLLEFINIVAKRALVIVLAVILVMLVASRNVEFELEQQALQEQIQTEQGVNLP